MKKLILILAIVLAMVTTANAETYFVSANGWHEYGDLAGYRFSTMFEFSIDEQLEEIDNIPIVLAVRPCQYEEGCYYTAWFIKIPEWIDPINRWRAIFNWGHPGTPEGEVFEMPGFINPTFSTINFFPFNVTDEEGSGSGPVRLWISPR